MMGFPRRISRGLISRIGDRVFERLVLGESSFQRGGEGISGAIPILPGSPTESHEDWGCAVAAFAIHRSPRTMQGAATLVQIPLESDGHGVAAGADHEDELPGRMFSLQTMAPVFTFVALASARAG